MVESKRTTKIAFQNKKVVSWDRHWEKIFRSQVWGKYPPEELIRFTSRNFYKFGEIGKLFKNYSSIERSERTENNMKDRIIHWVISCEKEDL